MGSSKMSLLTVVWLALLLGSNAEEKESEQARRPIKTFKTIYGETIDCIDMYRQPAFDHPLLKDHKLQKRPSFSLSSKNHRRRRRAQVNLLETSNGVGGCPDGTIPILRTTKNDRKRAKLHERTSPPTYHPTTSKTPGFHFAYVELNGGNNYYHGAKAYIDTYFPKCESGQLSGAQIWIMNDKDYTKNMIEVGWRVQPGYYKDDRAHFTTYWLGQNGKACIDVLCPGFVQIDPSFALGQALPNSSTYEGSQFVIHVGVQQDLNTKDWWLIVEKNNIEVRVGYWPATLLPDLASGAKTLQYGGVTYTSNNMPFPPMGSGLFPDNSYSHACYIRQIHYMDGSQAWVEPRYSEGSAHSSSEACYGAALNDADRFMGYTLLFGGPGGSSCGV